MGKKGQQAAISVLAALFLAISYIGIGYAAISGVPWIVEQVAYATIDDTASPFTKDQLVEGALATREYSFGAHDKEAYLETLRQMNRDAETHYSDVPDMLEAPIQYSLDEEAMSHLDDVNEMAVATMMPIFGVVAMAVFLIFCGLRMFGVMPVANALLWSGLAVVAVAAVFGIWALVSFDGLFEAFHSLLFADGSWTFSPDSLLITMLPEAFWSSMAAVWLSISLLVSAASIGLGLFMRRRQRGFSNTRGGSSAS